MKWELDDTTSDGIRFLLIGSGSLLLLRLLYSGVFLFIQAPYTADLPACLAEFRNGYLINDPYTLVHGGMEVGARLALAVVFSVVLGVGAGLITSLVSKAGVKVARIGLGLASLWFLYAALFLPPKEAVFTEEELILRTRPALLGELSMPWPAPESHHPWSSIERIDRRSAVSSLPEGTSTEFLEAVIDGERIVLASSKESSAAPRLDRLAGLLQKAYLRD